MLTNLKSFSVKYVLSQIIWARCLSEESQSVCKLSFIIPAACWIPILYPNIPALGSIGILLERCSSRGRQCEAFSQEYYFHNHFNCTCLIHTACVFICICSKGMQFNSKILSNHCNTHFTRWKNKTIKWIIRFSGFHKENWNFAWRRNNRSQGSLVEYFKVSCKSWVKHVVQRGHLVNCSDAVMSRWHKDQESRVWEPSLTGEE